MLPANEKLLRNSERWSRPETGALLNLDFYVHRDVMMTPKAFNQQFAGLLSPDLDQVEDRHAEIPLCAGRWHSQPPCLASFGGSERKFLAFLQFNLLGSLLNGGNHVVCRKRPPNSLQFELTDGLDLDGVLHLRQRSRPDKDLARLRLIA
jgi:hypothetical protein